MLTIRAHFTLNGLAHIILVKNNLSERLRINYDIMTAQVKPEKLLHIAMNPPWDFPAADTGKRPANYTIMLNRQEMKLDVINNLLNRILLDRNNYFIYRDTAHVKTMQSKFGITGISQFMQEIEAGREEAGQKQHFLTIKGLKEVGLAWPKGPSLSFFANHITINRLREMILSHLTDNRHMASYDNRQLIWYSIADAWHQWAKNVSHYIAGNSQPRQIYSLALTHDMQTEEMADGRQTEEADIQLGRQLERINEQNRQKYRQIIRNRKRKEEMFSPGSISGQMSNEIWEHFVTHETKEILRLAGLQMRKTGEAGSFAGQGLSPADVLYISGALVKPVMTHKESAATSQVISPVMADQNSIYDTIYEHWREREEIKGGHPSGEKEYGRRFADYRLLSMVHPVYNRIKMPDIVNRKYNESVLQKYSMPHIDLAQKQGTFQYFHNLVMAYPSDKTRQGYGQETAAIHQAEHVPSSIYETNLVHKKQKQMIKDKVFAEIYQQNRDLAEQTKELEEKLQADIAVKLEEYQTVQQDWDGRIREMEHMVINNVEKQMNQVSEQVMICLEEKLLLEQKRRGL